MTLDFDRNPPPLHIYKAETVVTLVECHVRNFTFEYDKHHIEMTASFVPILKISLSTHKPNVFTTIIRGNILPEESCREMKHENYR